MPVIGTRRRMRREAMVWKESSRQRPIATRPAGAADPGARAARPANRPQHALEAGQKLARSKGLAT